MDEQRQLWQIRQQEMVSQRIIPGTQGSYFPKKGETLVSLDVQYGENSAYVAADVMQWPDQAVGIWGKTFPISVPYQPGYFAFREGPLLFAMLEALENELNIQAHCLITDGHGLAHPRGMGLASWLGVKMNLPCLGIAKDSLLPYEGALGQEPGMRLAINAQGQVVGFAVRTRRGVKPLFVSPGHLISLEDSLQLVLALRGRYRQIEPLRRADQAARRLQKAYFNNSAKSSSLMDL